MVIMMQSGYQNQENISSCHHGIIPYHFIDLESVKITLYIGKNQIHIIRNEDTKMNYGTGEKTVLFYNKTSYKPEVAHGNTSAAIIFIAGLIPWIVLIVWFIVKYQDMILSFLRSL